MIETMEDCKQFFDKTFASQWFMHIIPTDENCHSADTTPCILFIKDLDSNQTYYISFNHPDSKPEFSVEMFVEKILKRAHNSKWVIDKKSFQQFLNLPDVYDVNLCGFLKNNEILELEDYNTNAHVMFRNRNCSSKIINRAIPLLKHLEYFEDMASDAVRMIKSYPIDAVVAKINDLIIDTLSELERCGVYVDAGLFQQFYQQQPNHKGLVFTEYNIYTSTGRPSNRFNNINYAALNTVDGRRKCFTSRFGSDGAMVLIDYSAFHPRIISFLVDYNIPPETDIYEYLARLYFNKKNIDETDISNAKKLTFRQLYGGVEDKYLHIKYLSKLKEYTNQQWKFFMDYGFVETPVFKRKITNNHIQDPNPSKLFNYILQAAEGEIAIPRIKKVQEYLKGKLTRPILYTYDSVLYDFHKTDGIETLNEIRNIMSVNARFPMKTYIGKSYGDMPLVTI